MTNTDLGGTPQEPRAGNGPGSDDASPRQMAAAAVQTVKQEAASFAESAKDKAIGQVEQKKQTATQTLSDFANAVRKASDELAQHDQSMAAGVVKQAADGLEGLSRSVSGKRPEELLDAVRDFGRSNPTAFIAGSVLLGLAIGRFARSSEPDSPGQGAQAGASTYIGSADFGSGPRGGAGSGGFDADNGDAASLQRLAAAEDAEQGDLNPMGHGRFDPEV